MKQTIPENNTINISNLNTFLVGGAVRDELLHRDIVERDYLVVGATPEKMLSLGFSQVGKDFPVFLHPKTKEEYALARTERKQGSGYTGFVCYAEPDVTIEEDLIRRDLTVNAMAMAIDEEGNSKGTIIDPYNGKKDLDDRILRHVSAAFIEDPLRVLRVARFSARYHSYGFTIADETMSLMQQISASGELAHLSAERIWKEVQRSLTEPHPEVFFKVLRSCGALKKMWPELDALWGVPNPPLWHPEICSGIHTMMVLQQAVRLTATLDEQTSCQIRFAAVCHDLGKGITNKSLWPSHKGHETYGLPLVERICQQLKVPTQYKTLALKVCEHHLHCHKAFELKASTLLNIFNQLDVWRKPDEFSAFIIACQSDFNGRKNFEELSYPQGEYLHACVIAAKTINAKSFVEQGLEGIKIKEAMHDARLREITKIKMEYTLKNEILANTKLESES